jgi:hypothetical protein
MSAVVTDMRERIEAALIELRRIGRDIGAVA